MLEKQYDSRAEFVAGPKEVVVFEGEKISLQLENAGDLSKIDREVEKGGWKMTPLNTMEVRKAAFCPPMSSCKLSMQR